MKNNGSFLCVIILLITIYSCDRSQDKVCEDDLREKIEKMYDISFTGCKCNNNLLEISYSDSIKYLQTELETEVMYYLVKDLAFRYRLDSVRFIISYPRRQGGGKRKGTLGWEEVRDAVEARYIKSDNYKYVIEDLFVNDKNGRLYINVFSNLYGYLSEKNPKKDEFYSKSIFILLYNYTLENEKGVYGKYNNMFDRLMLKCKHLELNSEMFVNKLDEIRNILKPTPPPPYSKTKTNK